MSCTQVTIDRTPGRVTSTNTRSASVRPSYESMLRRRYRADVSTGTRNTSPTTIKTNSREWVLLQYKSDSRTTSMVLILLCVSCSVISRIVSSKDSSMLQCRGGKLAMPYYRTSYYRLYFGQWRGVLLEYSPFAFHEYVLERVRTSTSQVASFVRQLFEHSSMSGSLHGCGNPSGQILRNRWCLRVQKVDILWDSESSVSRRFYENKV